MHNESAQQNIFLREIKHKKWFNNVLIQHPQAVSEFGYIAESDVSIESVSFISNSVANIFADALYPNNPSPVKFKDEWFDDLQDSSYPR